MVEIRWKYLIIWCTISKSLSLGVSLPTTPDEQQLNRTWSGKFDSLPKLQLNQEYTVIDLRLEKSQHLPKDSFHASNFNEISTLQKHSSPTTVDDKKQNYDLLDVPHSEKPSHLRFVSSLKLRQPHREPLLWREVEFTYHFRCGRSGRQQMPFRLRGAYYGRSGPTYDLRFENILGVENVDEISFERQSIHRPYPVEFSTSFQAHPCYALGTTLCFYTFSGHLEGILYQHQLLYWLNTDVDNHVVGPRVMETCIDLYGRGYCPALAVHQDQCDVERLDVRYIIR